MGDQQQTIHQLTRAVAHRTTTGVALGILMERYDLDQQEGFDDLRRLSSHHNRKLYDIAAEISETGLFLDVPKCSSHPLTTLL